MKGCANTFGFIYDIDLFGKEPELYFKGKAKKPSKIGLVFTIIYIILYISFFIYKLIRMIKRTDVTFYDSYAYNDFPSLKLTNENFYGGFSMGGIVDETLYYATATFHSGVKINGIWNYTVTPLDVEICKLEKFGSKYRELFKDQPLDNLYCMTKVNFTLEGYYNLDRYSYISVKVFPCVNQTRDGRACQSYTNIYKFFAANTIEFKMEDNLLNPESYKNPVVPLEKDINSPVFLTVYQKVYSYIQIVFVETDEDLTGLNFWAKNKIEKYPKYESSMLIAAPGTDKILQTGGAVCDVTMQLAAKILTQRRKYTTLIEVLGDVGGLMEILWSFLNLICSFITEVLYDRSLVNNLFSFDLEKKIVILKNKDFKKNENQNADIKKMETLRINNSLSELKQNNVEVYSKETLKQSNIEFYSKDTLGKYNQTNKKKIRIKKKRKSNDIRKRPTNLPLNNELQNVEQLNIEKSNSNNSNNLEKLQNSNNFEISNYIKSDDVPIDKNYDNKNSSNIGKADIKLDKIKINSCCLCCIKKDRNLNKYMLEEGVKLFTAKLDIINLFNKIIVVEKMQNSFNIDEKYIEMSEECKSFIDNYRKNFYEMLAIQ